MNWVDSLRQPTYLSLERSYIFIALFTSRVHWTRVRNLHSNARLPHVLLKFQRREVANFTEELNTIAYIQSRRQSRQLRGAKRSSAGAK